MHWVLAVDTQEASHSIVQQVGSRLQTRMQHVALSHPPGPCTARHDSTEVHWAEACSWQKIAAVVAAVHAINLME